MTQSWKTKVSDVAASHMLAQACGISSILANVLSARDLTDIDKAQRFLNPDLFRDWTSPTDIYGMARVCDILEQAIADKKRILIFGDFDVDGITATALMVRGLSALGVSADYLIPNRIHEGYGLTEAAVNKIIERAPQLVVTVDCGISSKEEVDVLLAHGIQVIVTDHHEPSENVPTDIAVTDPRLNEDPSEYTLAGVGVSLKLMALLGGRLGKPELWHDLIDLVALGTIADMMPALGENRSLISAGLTKLQESSRPGIASLLALTHKPHTILRSKDLSFTLIPRLNAAGRMGDPDLALQLLIDDDPVRAHDTALALDEINKERKTAETELLKEAVAQVEQDFHDQKVIVVAGVGWHEGVKGIIATRLVKKYGVPAIVFSIMDGEARASGRSVGGVNLFKAVESCSDILIRFGGHDAAVGITLKQENLSDFKARIEAVMAQIPDDEFHPAILVDSELKLGEISVEAVLELDKLEPYGQSNAEPLFASRGLFLRNARAVGANKNHLSFTVTDGSKSAAAIWFQCPDVESFLGYEGPADVIYNLAVDEWNGNKRVKLFVTNVFINTAESSSSNDPSNDQQPLHKAPSLSGSTLADDELASRLAGAPLTLHEAQRQALHDLSGGKSLLAVMATGRGKSLIFQTHAARLALAEHGVSIFIYPLRALIADQCAALNDGFSQLGLTAKALTGELRSDEKDAIFEQLYEGKVDAILTTPEFFQLHQWRFAGSNRIRFIVFDEAHHLASQPQVNREAYHLTRELHQLFKNAQFLAVTATADDQITRSVCQALNIDKVLVDDYRRNNLNIEDARNIGDRTGHALDIANRSAKSVVYVNSRAAAVDLVRAIRKLHSGGRSEASPREDAPSAAIFYHGGLKRSERKEIESGFRVGKYKTLVSTSAFGEGVNISDISDVVLFHLPFNIVAFNQMSGRAGRDGRDARVHLLFHESDVDSNRKILRSNSPARPELVTLYRALQKFLNDRGAKARDFMLEEMCFSAIQELCQSVDKQSQLGARALLSALSIFEELGLINFDRVGNEVMISWRNNKSKVELDTSSRYLEGKEELHLFEQFKDWAFTTTADTMREYIRGPLTPIKMMATGAGDEK